MSSETSLAIMQRFVAAVLSGDLDTVRALAAPEMELHQGSGLPYAGVYKGAEGFIEFLGAFGETWEIERLEPVRNFLGEDPEWVASELAFAATSRATGKRFESSLVEVWHIRGGKVLLIKPHYFNSPLAE
jgi:uncharacterized protein